MISAVGFGFTLRKTTAEADIGAGLDLTRVNETEGIFSTMVGRCEVRVVAGRIEDRASRTSSGRAVVVLPCNEYFDDRCVDDSTSSLGAYVNRAFEGQVADFVELVQTECRSRLGPTSQQEKTDGEWADSYGPGHAILLLRPLGRSTPIALIATTTQRSGQGLAGRISYLFDGVRAVATRLADERLNEIMMPVLGAGHGGIDPPLAFVGLLLAVAEATRVRPGNRLRRVTIVVFQATRDSAPEVDELVIRRALALIGSRR